jgi:dienelactone hydrolase
MIHENKGLNENIKNIANLLAKNGYVVLAVDYLKVRLPLIEIVHRSQSANRSRIIKM